ncbi:ATP-binding cassette domain-containing protein [Ulvibacterium sp.]|uniref:ABC transporter ATP-binding protein n=1 Tax=Ulvibacterium sp. TaxID=2665914 RepID=UPI002605F71D|nr:ABC transporter ATP-binding protein [Ulvibacterium sp.]
MLQLKSLSYHYPKSKTVLDNVSLTFAEGTIYGLFGKNGEGKSTLMKIMSGLLFPKSGQCTILGQPTAKRLASSLQNLFLVPEDFELPNLTIATYEKIYSPFYPAFSRHLFYELLQEFKLHHQEKTARLSFGQKKKILIAFGIATQTKLLLLDEPTNGLDIPSKSQFRKIMAEAVDQGRSIIISTHQVRDLHSLIDQIVILDNCKVIFDHSLSEISENLWFGRASNVPNEVILYTETSFGGKAVMKRLDQEETEVDLELLFNAVLNNPKGIQLALEQVYHGV